MNDITLEDLLKKIPGVAPCLHNGFAGFSWGSPSNPQFLTYDKAVSILNEIENESGKNVFEILLKLYEEKYFLMIDIDKFAPILYKKLNFRFFGLFDPKACSYGDHGFG